MAKACRKSWRCLCSSHRRPALGGIIAIFPWQGIFRFCVLWAVAIGAWSLRLSETSTLRTGQRSISKRRCVATSVSAPLVFPLPTPWLRFSSKQSCLYLSASEQMISDILGEAASFHSFSAWSLFSSGSLPC